MNLVQGAELPGSIRNYFIFCLLPSKWRDFIMNELRKCGYRYRAESDYVQLLSKSYLKRYKSLMCNKV